MLIGEFSEKVVAQSHIAHSVPAVLSLYIAGNNRTIRVPEMTWDALIGSGPSTKSQLLTRSCFGQLMNAGKSASGASTISLQSKIFPIWRCERISEANYRSTGSIGHQTGCFRDRGGIRTHMRLVEHGSATLSKLFGKAAFSFAKSPHAVKTAFGLGLVI